MSFFDFMNHVGLAFVLLWLAGMVWRWRYLTEAEREEYNKTDPYRAFTSGIAYGFVICIVWNWFSPITFKEAADLTVALGFMFDGVHFCKYLWKLRRIS